MAKLVPSTDEELLAYAKKIAMTVTQIEIVGQDYDYREIDRKHYDVKPGDTVTWTKNLKNIYWINVLSFDAQGKEIYSNRYEVINQRVIHYVVPTAEDVRYE